MIKIADRDCCLFMKKETREISPCVEKKKPSEKYPTMTNKAHTGGLSRFVGEKTPSG
jgi:hypothetical protein